MKGQLLDHFKKISLKILKKVVAFLKSLLYNESKIKT